MAPKHHMRSESTSRPFLNNPPTKDLKATEWLNGTVRRDEVKQI